MYRTLLLALLVPVASVAAPIPKGTDADRLKKLFGTPVDADKACTFELIEGDRLRVRAPASHQTQIPFTDLVNVPRVVREVEGDTVLRVKLSDAIDPDAGPGLGAVARIATAGAGLVISDGNGTRVLFYQRRSRRNGKWATGLVFSRAWPEYYEICPRQAPGDEAVTHLRLIVRAGRVTAESSRDGKAWNQVIAKDVPLTGKMNAGVFVLQHTNKRYEAIFDDLTSTPLQPDGREARRDPGGDGPRYADNSGAR